MLRTSEKKTVRLQRSHVSFASAELTDIVYLEGEN